MDHGKPGFPDLQRLVRPRNVLVVGGSKQPNSEGARLLENLATHSRLVGELLVVNPKMAADPDPGYRCWPSIAELPDLPIDVALLMVRGSRVLEALEGCAARRIPFAVVMASGFGEAGAEGKAVEDQIRALCARTGLRVYGPNCPGITNLRDRIGMTFSPAFRTDINPGTIGIVTQGGGSGRNLLQGLSFGAGAALWLSAGNEVDLGAPDFIAHMAQDPDIRVIAVLLEGINRGRDLVAALELARRRGKPVIIMKLGRSELGVRAAQSHTGSIAGAAEINRAVFRQYGAIEVDEIDELVAVARLLASPQRPATSRLAIVTFSGGAAGMAADQAGVEGLELARFSPATIEHLRSMLPSYAAVDNPVDVTSEALKTMETFASCLRSVAADPDVGAVLLPIPADYAAVTESIAQAIVEVAAVATKPLIPIWMSRRLGKGFQLLEESGLAPFLSLSKAVRALRRAAPSTRTLAPPPAAKTHDDGAAPALLACTEAEAKRMLQEAGISVPQGVLATSPAEAETAARKLGMPVVMKVASAQILHKTEVGGVRLGVASTAQAGQVYEEMVRHVSAQRPDAIIDGVLVEKMLDGRGREMLVSIHSDPVFGRVITMGLGGVFVELMKDVAHRVLPIRRDDALEMVAELRHGTYLERFRGLPAADVPALADLMVRLSQFAMDHPEVEEVELNPVWVGSEGEGACALDALVLTALPTCTPIHQHQDA